MKAGAFAVASSGDIPGNDVTATVARFEGDCSGAGGEIVGWLLAVIRILLIAISVRSSERLHSHQRDQGSSHSLSTT